MWVIFCEGQQTVTPYHPLMDLYISDNVISVLYVYHNGMLVIETHAARVPPAVEVSYTFSMR